MNCSLFENLRVQASQILVSTHLLGNSDFITNFDYIDNFPARVF